MVNLGIIGVGLVGSELISQLLSYSKHASSYSPTFKVVALANTSKHLLSNASYDSIDLSSWNSILKTNGVPVNIDAFVEYLSNSPDTAVVIDNTASQEIAHLYPQFLRKGLHIATPNKKAFSGDIKLYKEILAEATRNRKLVYHESSVGAGLPVLSTLNDLIKTGDEIIKIEGIFSGTLSYLFNNFSYSSISNESPKFSEIVMVAKNSGYTEPDPRDDLNGLDVARKVIILGRIAGLDLTLETLPVENIVPESLRAVPTSAEFLTKLPEFDNHFESLNQKARSSNQVLRYIGTVDVKGGNSSVKLMSLPVSHPFASLKGSDNIIAFTTRRFPNPLIIQGAGAGAAVTAFGVFSDLFKIAERSS
ncbi:5019_t:CDS:2 [Ambispora leptoticha]|uniref:Homoserine dehydrogenase n=1 Tax=Ambispora leptoticha TaxID=144679 RepID=A0A9N8ZLE4_9GLOM|nr:5019_t:CDS:2 [Ambispora leptoticha]